MWVQAVDFTKNQIHDVWLRLCISIPCGLKGLHLLSTYFREHDSRYVDGMHQNDYRIDIKNIVYSRYVCGMHQNDYRIVIGLSYIVTLRTLSPFPNTLAGIADPPTFTYRKDDLYYPYLCIYCLRGWELRKISRAKNSSKFTPFRSFLAFANAF